MKACSWISLLLALTLQAAPAFADPALDYLNYLDLRTPLPSSQNLAVGSCPYEAKKDVVQQPCRALTLAPQDERWLALTMVYFPGQLRLCESELRQNGIGQLWKAKRFDALDVAADTLRQRRLVGRDGQLLAQAFYRDLYAKLRDQGIDRSLPLLEEWRKSQPRSLVARLALGRLLTLQAWQRLDRTPEARRQFRERLLQAQAVLQEGAQLDQDPETYTLLIDVGKGLALPRAQLRGWLDRAWKLDVLHAWNATRSYADSLLPRWRGRPGELEAFLREAVERTRPRLGETLYAYVMDSFADVIKDDEVAYDYPRLLRAFQDWIRACPESLGAYEAYTQMAIDAHNLKLAQTTRQRQIDLRTVLGLSDADVQSLSESVGRLKQRAK